MNDLDKCMAEKVMGWKLDEYLNCQYFTVEHSRVILASNWTPSTDITQAFMVMEKLLKWGFNIEIVLWADNIQNEVIYHRPHDMAIGKIQDFKIDALAEAFCLAAKKAMESI